MTVHPFAGETPVGLDRENAPATLRVEPSLSRFEVIDSALFRPYGAPLFAFQRQLVRLPSA